VRRRAKLLRSVMYVCPVVLVCRETVRLQFFSEADNIIAGGNVVSDLLRDTHHLACWGSSNVLSSL
jgi:hypothetical protein